MDQKLCTCGHSHEAHEHYRRGSDCGICGAEICAAYRSDSSASAGSSAAARPVEWQRRRQN